MKFMKAVLTLLIITFLGINFTSHVHASHETSGEENEESNNDDFWEDDVKQYESVHDHTTYQGGQVGMSGDLHVEFVVKEKGEYRIYITGYERDPIDISKATGFLIIDPEGLDPEKLVLSVDKILQEFLWVKGKPRKQGETISVSTEVEIPGQEKIIQSFYIEISHSTTEHKTGHEEKKDGHHNN